MRRLLRRHGGRGKKLTNDWRRRFAFRLALALGQLDVDAMLRAMPAGMLDEWYAYYRLEPWGEAWECMAAGTTTVANEIRAIASAFGGGNFEPIEPEQLIPHRCDETRKKSLEAVETALDAMTGI